MKSMPYIYSCENCHHIKRWEGAGLQIYGECRLTNAPKYLERNTLLRANQWPKVELYAVCPEHKMHEDEDD